jgi:hypothetical protein
MAGFVAAAGYGHKRLPVRVVFLLGVVHPPAAVLAFVAHYGWLAAAVVKGERAQFFSLMS